MKKVLSVFLAVIMLTASFMLPFDVSAATKRCEITSSNPTVVIRWSYTTGTVKYNNKTYKIVKGVAK